jgi:hypothetical protein
LKWHSVSNQSHFLEHEYPSALILAEANKNFKEQNVKMSFPIPAKSMELKFNMTQNEEMYR